MLRDSLVGSSQTMTNRAALIDFNASLLTGIGSIDPYALKIPARRAECSLTEIAPLHFTLNQNSLRLTGSV